MEAMSIDRDFQVSDFLWNLLEQMRHRLPGFLEVEAQLEALQRHLRDLLGQLLQGRAQGPRLLLEIQAELRETVRQVPEKLLEGR